MSSELIRLSVGLAAITASCQSAAAELSVWDLLPDHGKQHFVEITFPDPANAYLHLVLEYEFRYNAYDKITGEELYGNTFEGYEVLILDQSGIYQEGREIYWPRFRDGTLAFWLKYTPFERAQGAWDWGCKNDPGVRCERWGGYTPNSFVQFGGQDVSIRFSRQSAIPEPASWLLMIAGFGLIGTALRGRSKASAAGV
jgi:hypothetical protein